MNPAGKVVWIAGASSGIGAALAVEMARAGAKLILSARREDKLQAVAERCREHASDVHVLPLDMTRIETFPETLSHVEALLGPIDMLVLNAGIGQRGRALEVELEVIRRLFEVDFFGTIELARIVGNGMAKRGSGQIVVTSSVLGLMSVPGRSGYCAAKHALQGYFNSLRAEVARSGVTVTMICPGYIRTEISLHALEPDGSEHGRMDGGQDKGMSADECAARMMSAIHRDKAQVVIGGFLEKIGVLAARWCPALYRWGLARVDVDEGEL